MPRKRDRIFDIPIFLLLKFMLIILSLSKGFREVYLPAFLSAVFKRHRKYGKIIRKNLDITKIVKDSESSKQLMDKIYYNVARNAIDTLDYYRKTPEQAEMDFIFSNHDLINRLKKRPCLYITAHIGNFEYIASFFYPFGIRNNVIARRMDNPYIDRWTKSHREKYGNKVIYQEGSIYYIGDGFTRNENCFMLIDHRAPKAYGIWVSFFGLPAITLKIPAFFALRLNIDIVPIFCLKENDKYRVILIEPVPPVKEYSRDFNIFANTQRYTQIIEQIIKKYPEQWLWSYERWRIKPDHRELEEYKKNYDMFIREGLSYKFQE